VLWGLLQIHNLVRRSDVISDEARADRPGPAADLPPLSPPGDHAPGPALQGLLALVIYLAVFVAGFGLALVGHLRVPRVGQSNVDPNMFIWYWQWWPYALSHGHNPLYTHAIGAPAGWNLAAWATSAPPAALLMSPVTAFFGPVASFNLTLLLAPPTAAWAAFLAARRLTGRFWAALLAGAAYGFNAYEVAHDLSGQPNLTVTLLFPLLAYLVLLWRDGTLGRTGFVVWMTLALAVAFYIFTEYFFDMTLVTAVALLIAFAVAGRAARRTVARLAKLTAISYAGALVLASPYLFDELMHLPAGLTHNTPQFSLSLAALIVPRPDRPWGSLPAMSSLRTPHEQDMYIGIPMLVLLLVFAVVTWSSKVTRLLVAIFAVVLVLAAGPYLIITSQSAFTLPWSGLWNLPIARSAEACRIILFGHLVLAFVLALWLAAPVRSRALSAARWGLAVVALAAMFANLGTFAETVVPPPPHYKPAVASLRATDTLPAFITKGLYRRYLKPGETVVVLSHRGNAGMLFQAYTDFYFRIAGGFINASLNDTSALPRPVQVLTYLPGAVGAQRVENFKVYFKRTHIGAIIVERAWSERWMYVFGRLGMKGTTVGGVTMYRPRLPPSGN
jgi:hypothetical protein